MTGGFGGIVLTAGLRLSQEFGPPFGGWLPNFFGSISGVCLSSDLNPEGFSPFEFCPACGWRFSPRCSSERPFNS